MADQQPPWDDSLMPAEQPEKLGDIELTEERLRYAAARWPGESERMQAYRIRQAIWVRFEHQKPHPEDPGRKVLGGPQPNSGRKRQPIGKAIVEHFEARTKEVLDAIAAPLSPNSDASAMERHKAGMNIAKHAREEERNQREADAYARATDDEVRRGYAEMIAGMVARGELTKEQVFGEQQTVDSTAEEIPAGQIAETAGG